MNTEQIEALKALAEAARDKPVLSPDGIVYFDAVTPAVILELLASATASAGRIAELEALVARYEARMLRMATCAGEFARDAALAGSATPSTAPAAQAEAVAMDAVAKFAELMISEFFTGPKYKATRYDIRGLAKDFKPAYWDVAGTKAAKVAPQDTLKNADSEIGEQK